MDEKSERKMGGQPAAYPAVAAGALVGAGVGLVWGFRDMVAMKCLRFTFCYGPLETVLMAPVGLAVMDRSSRSSEHGARPRLGIWLQRGVVLTRAGHAAALSRMAVCQTRPSCVNTGRSPAARAVAMIARGSWT